jgi:nicotinate-nucleotide pyrophosphorylase (carboxylating)
MSQLELPADIGATVARALAEDLGSGDVTAALIDGERRATARLIVREHAILCGTAWFDETFRRVDAAIRTRWRSSDGEPLAPGSIVCELDGPARGLLTGERTALNFLQTLSGTATQASRYVEQVRGTGARILDTRKTLPGLRTAQKYAVRCGGAFNHRTGLFDAVLIKENHIAACGSLSAAVQRAGLSSPSLLIEVEVETLDQVREALDTAANRLLLDNFAPGELRAAVELRDRHPGARKELEASGGIDIAGIRTIAETGVDWISIGAMTKHLHATDYSLRFV